MAKVTQLRPCGPGCPVLVARGRCERHVGQRPPPAPSRVWVGTMTRNGTRLVLVRQR